MKMCSVLQRSHFGNNRIGFEQSHSGISVRVKAHQGRSWCVSMRVFVSELICIGDDGGQGIS